MRKIKINGVQYRSIRAACIAYDVPYGQVMRLVRYHKKFQHDPVAAIFAIKVEDWQSIATSVAKTDVYYQDKAITRLRVKEYRFRKRTEKAKALIALTA